MGFSRQRRSSLEASMVAHVDHSKPFFAPELAETSPEEVSLVDFLRYSNATVQPWLGDQLYASRPFSSMVSIVQQSRSTAGALLRRLCRAGVLQISDSDAVQRSNPPGTAAQLLESHGRLRADSPDTHRHVARYDVKTEVTQPRHHGDNHANKVDFVTPKRVARNGSLLLSFFANTSVYHCGFVYEKQEIRRNF